MEGAIFRNFEPTLGIVDRLQKSIKGNFKIEAISAKNFNVEIMKRQPKGFGFEIKYDASKAKRGFDFDNFEAFENVVINTKTIGTIHGDYLDTNSYSPGYLSGRAYQFSSTAISENQRYYFRQVLVLAEKTDFIFFIEDEVFQYSEFSSRRGMVRVSFLNGSFGVFTHIEKKTGKAFLVIDSFEKMEYKEFSEKAYTILIALGFVTGKFHQNEGYYFGFDEEKMDTPSFWRFRDLRDSKKTLCQPIYSNAHGIIHDDNVAAKKFQPLLKPMPQSTFSNLCQKIYEKSEFQALLVLMFESCNTSLLLMPAGLSVILEGLRNLIIEEKEKSAAFLDKGVSKNIKNEIKAVVLKYENEISKEGKKILEARINDLDKPTNQAQLLKPFEIYGIELSDLDKICLKNRNHFLHGRISLGYYEKGDDVKAGEEMYFNSLKLYTLVSALILKYIGYEGFVINQAKVQQRSVGRVVEEPYFIRI